jgi:hypothetical protein
MTEEIVRKYSTTGYSNMFLNATHQDFPNAQQTTFSDIYGFPLD